MQKQPCNLNYDRFESIVIYILTFQMPIVFGKYQSRFLFKARIHSKTLYLRLP